MYLEPHLRAEAKKKPTRKRQKATTVNPGARASAQKARGTRKVPLNVNPAIRASAAKGRAKHADVTNAPPGAQVEQRVAGKTLAPYPRARDNRGAGLLGDIGHFVGDVAHKVYGRPAKRGSGGSRLASSSGASTGLGISQGVPYRAAKNIAQATVEDPSAVLGTTAKTVPQIAASTVSGLATVVVHPKSVADLPQAFVKDISRRYGPLLDGTPEGEREFRDRLKKEGIAPEVIDVFTVAVPSGAVIGRAGGALARTGALGSKLERVASEARPGLRFAPGAHGVRPQALSPNLVTAGAQKALDARRRAAYAKRAGDQSLPLAERPVVRGVAPGEGEVVPRVGKQGRMQRKVAARETSREQTRFQRLRSEDVRPAIKDIARLNKNELKALKYQIQFPSATNDITPTLNALRGHVDNIASNRLDASVSPGATDELSTIEQILKDPDKHFTPRVREVADQMRERTQRTGALDPSIDAETLAHRPLQDQAMHLVQVQQRARKAGEHVENPLPKPRPEELKDPGAYVKRVSPDRVRRAAKEAGLAEPGYWPGHEEVKGKYGSHTQGSAMQATSGPRKHTGHNFRMGLQSGDPESLLAEMGKNIKRNVNHNLVSNIEEAHVPEWGRNLNARDLSKVIREHGEDPSDYVAYDPGIARTLIPDDEALEKLEDVERSTSLHKALESAIMDIDGAAAKYSRTNKKFPVQGPDGKTYYVAPSTRLSILPKGVANELKAQATPGSAGLRLAQKAQGFQSRMLLHTNPTFVPVQILQQTPLALLAAKGNVKGLLGGTRFYKNLDKHTQGYIDDLLGLSLSRSHGASPKMGATNSLLTETMGKVFNNPKVWNFRDSNFNPLVWNPHLDDVQNKWFRRAVLNDQLKRDRASRIRATSKGIVQDSPPLMDVLKMPSSTREEALAKAAALKKAQPEFERLNEKINDLLGDYTNYTARERKYLKTGLLFYGFLRWSVKFAFYTLPVKHPIVASMTAKLGQLHREELVDLLSDDAAKHGAATKPEAEELLRGGALPWAFGRVYFDRAGDLKSVDFTRLNPVANPIVEALGSPKDAITGLMSPVLQGVYSALWKEDALGREINTHGHKTGFGEEPEVSPEDAFRIIGRSFAEAAYPVRFIDSLRNTEEQGADSLPILGDRPIVPATDNQLATAKRKAKEKGSTGHRAQEMLLPFGSQRNSPIYPSIAYLAGQQRKKKARKRPKSSGDNGVNLGSSVNLGDDVNLGSSVNLD